MTIQECITELKILIVGNEPALEFLNEIESGITDIENEKSNLEDEKEYLERSYELFDSFDYSEYELPLGTVKIWSDNLNLKMKLEAFVEHVL